MKTFIATLTTTLLLASPALADGKISENEKREIEPVLQRVEARLHGVRSALDREMAA